MDDQESLYKREEDREWRKQVDSARALLTTAVNVLQEQVRELKRWKVETDAALRGHGPHIGLFAEYERLDEMYRKLYAVIWQDSTGRKGMVHDVDFLMGRSKNHDEISVRRWTFAQGVVVALVSALAAITVAVLSIEPVRKQIGIWVDSHFSTRLHPGSKTRTRRIGNKSKRRQQPPPEEEPQDEPSDEGVQ